MRDFLAVSAEQTFKVVAGVTPRQVKPRGARQESTTSAVVGRDRAGGEMRTPWRHARPGVTCSVTKTVMDR